MLGDRPSQCELARNVACFWHRIWGRQIEETKARLASQGVELGPLLTASPTAPWANKVKVREAKGPDVINTQFSFGQIDFADGVVQFVDV